MKKIISVNNFFFKHKKIIEVYQFVIRIIITILVPMHSVPFGVYYVFIIVVDSIKYIEVYIFK